MTDKRSLGPWFRMSAHYQHDPRIMRAGPHAELVYIRGLALSRALGTDGHVDALHVPILTRGLGRRAVLSTLVEVDLWEPCADGWRVPSSRWEKWQTTEAQYQEKAEAERAANAARQKRWRDKQKQPPTST